MISFRRIVAVLALVGTTVALDACSSGQTPSMRAVSFLEKGCSSHGGGHASIQSRVHINGDDLVLPGSCTISVDDGSLTITGIHAKVGTLAFVLSPHAQLVINSSEIEGSSLGATLTVTSSGNGQTVSFDHDQFLVGRGILVEVGLGTTATTGVVKLSVTHTSVVARVAGGLGAQFLSKGAALFQDDSFEVPGIPGAASVRSATPAQCRMEAVSGIPAGGCQPFG